MRQESGLIQTIFRKEFSKMVAVISRLFGIHHIEIAEDIVSETFLQASETWAIKGIPPNPPAWLYHVAKQKTYYHFRRQKIFTDKVTPALKAAETTQAEMPELDFSRQNIRDSQLQMMFAICNPAVSSEAQIGLALRILCGFGIDEIAEAFLSNKETINKRLFRAKEKLRAERISLAVPTASQIDDRLNTVLHIIYLLFNEGYYSATQNSVLRKDLCLEAIRLGLMLTAYPPANTPRTNALVALMCYHASRFDARQSSDNHMILYDYQDKSLWNQELIDRGNHYLGLAAQGNEISSYHLEAGIAFWHCQKVDSPEKWQAILRHYDLLLQVNYSPGVALNRVYAFYKARGNEAAIGEAENLQMNGSHFYFTLLGELYKDVDKNKATTCFQKAFDLAKTEADRQTIQMKMELMKT